VQTSAHDAGIFASHGRTADWTGGRHPGFDKCGARDVLRDRWKEDIVRFIPIVIVMPVVMAAGVAAAQDSDPNLARNLAATCANCHGTNGVSVGTTESLAGQAKADIARKMQEYKSGARPGTIMPQLAKGYTDAQIDLISGWFAAQKAAK
jgi:cytochrome c553